MPFRDDGVAGAVPSPVFDALFAAECLPLTEQPPPIPLGTSEPLTAAARLLLDRTPDDLGEIDLSRLLVVTPGGRAGRQFLLSLEEAATASGLRFVPPRVVTPSELVFALRGLPEMPVAEEATVRAALASVLDSETPEVLGGIIAGGADLLERWSVAASILSADRSVSAAEVSWSEMAEVAVQVGGDPERYLRIAEVMTRTEEVLASTGKCSREEAMRSVLESSGATESDPIDEVALIGVVDLSKRQESALGGIACRVMVIADRIAGGFDSLGRLVPEFWIRNPPVIPVASLQVEDKPIDEAEAVVEMVADPGMESSEAGGIDPDALAIVVADETSAESFRREFEAAGVRAHMAGGRLIGRMAIARTLGVLADFLERRDSNAFGRLLEDPSFAVAVNRRLVGKNAAAAWSSWAEQNMPRPLVAGWPGDPSEVQHERDSEVRTVLAAADVVVNELLGSLGSTSEMPFADAIAAILDLLRRLDEEEKDGLWPVDVLSRIRDAACELASTPVEIQQYVLVADGLRLLLEAIAPVRVPDPPEAGAIETIGWLEAPFDPAARVIVTGCHDAVLPGRFVDPILPDRLRTAAGIEDERRRHARDLWVLSTILGRDPRARFIVPRRDSRGEPRVPSRLIFGDRGESLARRVVEVFAPPRVRSRGDRALSLFSRPRPTGADDAADPVTLERLSVTGFKNYLVSPYRFWLRTILGLKAPEPVGAELDARLFGIALHEAVEVFGFEEIERLKRGEAHATDAGLIHERLVAAMSSGLDRLCGPNRGAGLRLQNRILEARLEHVAVEQAKMAVDGWRIHAVEERLDALLPIPGDTPMRVTGRIDRIDHHPDLGWRLIDFKSSDSGTTPDKAHRKSDRWIDLQLPLYRGLHAAQLPGSPDAADIATGYFLVGADPTKIKFTPSKRIDELQEDAMDTAVQVVRDIRAGHFEHLGDPPWEHDPIALVQRTQTLGADDGGADE